MPGAGPILLFDKSILQSLSVDEAVWLDTFYFPCITPVFFTETLADLEKEVQKGRSPEEVVGNLAEKTPIGGAINVYHQTLSVNELLGRTVELRHAPVVPGGNPVNAPNGRRAVVYDPSRASTLIRSLGRGETSLSGSAVQRIYLPRKLQPQNWCASLVLDMWQSRSLATSPMI
jgi:hypothetical protein